MCAGCRRYRGQLRAVDRAVGEFVRDESDDSGAALPDAAKARIAARLRSPAAGDGTA